MDFHNRQYDPQLGRFLGIDALANAGRQQYLIPYHAMGCNPVTLIDPLGLMSFNAGDKLFDYGVPNVGVSNIDGVGFIFGGSWLEPFEKQLERLNERAAMLAEEAHLRAITGVYQALLEFLSVYGSETLLSGGTLVFSTDPKDGVIDVLVVAKGNDELGGEEQANGGEESNKGQQSSGGQDWFKISKSIFDNGTFIPGTALSYVETKAGKMMAIGGTHVWKSSTYSAQRNIARELAIGSKGIARVGNTLGGIGLGLTATDMIMNGVNTSNTLDAAMGIISFVPGWGWIAGGIYFIGNATLEATTGKNLGQHIGGWID